MYIALINEKTSNFNIFRMQQKTAETDFLKKHDIGTFSKITPSAARNLQHLLQAEKSNTTLHKTK